LFPYPAWAIKVNARPVEPLLRPGTGQLVIPVQAGSNQVEINFVRTSDRKAGGWLSGITAALTLVWIVVGDRRGTHIVN
jgi:hypothetical protein